MSEVKLPQGWVEKKLGEVCCVIAGQSPEGKYYNSEGYGLPFYQGKREFTERYIGTPTTWTSMITKEAKQGDILMSVRAPVGPVNIATQRMCIGRGLASIRISENILGDYVYYYLKKHENEIVGNAGSVFNSINKSQIENIKLPLPPFSEQERIVAKLDEIFADIEVAKENLKRNFQNSKELFQNELNRIFENQGKDWEKKKLGEICEKITDGTHQTPTYGTEGYIFLSSKNVTSGVIDWDHVKYIDEKQHIEMQKRVSPKAGDILLAKNGTTGVAAMVDKDITFDIYVSLAMLRPKGIISSRYLLQFVNSIVAKRQFNKRLKGSGVPNLHLIEIKEVIITYPKSMIEQEQVVTRSNLLKDQTEQVEQLYKQKLLSLEELKKSLLQKAFNGEL